MAGKWSPSVACPGEALLRHGPGEGSLLRRPTHEGPGGWGGTAGAWPQRNLHGLLRTTSPSSCLGSEGWALAGGLGQGHRPGSLNVHL